MNKLLTESTKLLGITPEFLRKINETSCEDVDVEYLLVDDESDEKPHKFHMIWDNDTSISKVSEMLDATQNCFDGVTITMSMGAEAEADNEDVEETYEEATAEVVSEDVEEPYEEATAEVESEDVEEPYEEATAEVVSEDVEEPYEEAAAEVVSEDVEEPYEEAAEEVVREEEKTPEVEPTKAPASENTVPEKVTLSKEECDRVIADKLVPSLKVYNFTGDDYRGAVTNFCDAQKIKSDVFRLTLLGVRASDITDLDKLLQNVAKTLNKNKAMVKVQLTTTFTKWMNENYPEFLLEYPDVNVLNFLNIFREKERKF